MYVKNYFGREVIQTKRHYRRLVVISTDDGTFLEQENQIFF